MQSKLASLDHVIVAVRDLDAASAQVATLLGRAPSWQGSHPSLATENSLFGLDNTYLELLAPDRNGPAAGTLGARLAEHLAGPGEGVFGLAFGTPDAEGFRGQAESAGMTPTDPQPGRGVDAESGRERSWQNVYLPGDQTRGVPVFAIEHTGGELPRREPEQPEASVEALDHVVVMSGDLEASRRLYGDQLGLRLALDRTFEGRGQRILFFRVGGATVEVVGAADGGDGGPDRLWGLAWRVPDVAAARDRLAAAGLPVSEVRAGAKPGTRVFTVRGEPQGVPTLVIGPDVEPDGGKR